MGQLLFMVGKETQPCKEPVGPGAILALAKLKDTKHRRHPLRREGPLHLRQARPAQAHDLLRPGPG